MRESARAKQAFNDYFAMGGGRSLRKLFAYYRANRGVAQTTQFKSLAKWSREFGWQERLEAIADRETAAVAEREAAYRRSIMEAGYALTHERVKALQELAAILFGEITDRECRWLREVKIVGRGEAVRAVDVERFNHHEVEQFRGILDDIAKELGERKQRQEHSGPGGGPIQYERSVDSAALRAAEDAYLAALGLEPAAVGMPGGDDSPPDEGPDTL